MSKRNMKVRKEKKKQEQEQKQNNFVLEVHDSTITKQTKIGGTNG